MDEPRRIEKSELRTLLRSLGEGGKEISYPLVYEAMQVTSTSEKDRVRALVGAMVQAGELVRNERGTFTYNFKYRLRKGQGYDAIWRFVRAEKPGWTIMDASLMTKQSYMHVAKYVNWLEGEQYVVRDGKRENRLLYRNTQKARNAPETPYPPGKDTDPFARERVAAATITRLMLCANPYSLKTARGICEACKVLLARFENFNTEILTENENGEETC